MLQISKFMLANMNAVTLFLSSKSTSSFHGLFLNMTLPEQ